MGEQSRALDGHLAAVNSIVLLPDGQIASGGEDGNIAVWHPDDEQVRSVWEAHAGPVRGLTLLPDSHLVSVDAAQTVHVWDLATHRKVVVRANAWSSESPSAVMPDGRIALGGDDGFVRFWDLYSDEVEVGPRAQGLPVSAITVTTDGCIATGGSDGRVHLVAPDNGEEVSQFCDPHHALPVENVEGLSSNGIAIGIRDAPLIIWDPTDGQYVEIAAIPSDVVSSLTSLEGRRIAIGTRDARIIVFSLESEKQERIYTGHTGKVWDLVALPDGRIVSASEDGSARIWAPDGVCERIIQCHPLGQIETLVVTPDGNDLVTGGADGTVRVWGTEDGANTLTLEGHTDWVRAVAVLPDGRIVSAGDDLTVRVWSSEDGANTLTLEGHTDWVRAVAVLPDGRIVSAGDDLTVRVWSTDDGANTITLHLGPVSSIATHPFEGQMVATVGPDGHMRIIDVDRAKQVFGTQDSLPDAHPHARPVADLPSGVDLLDMDMDVDRIARMLTARGDTNTASSVAVALMAEWGSGKSSFMTQLQRRIVEICARSSSDRHMSVAFVGNVAQVVFNAWHYSDVHALVGMSQQIFRGLNEENDLGWVESGDDARKIRADVLVDIGQLKAELAEADAEVADLRSTAPTAGSVVGAATGYFRDSIREIRRGRRVLPRIVWVFGLVVILGLMAVWTFLPSAIEDFGIWLGALVAVLGVGLPLAELVPRAKKSVETLGAMRDWWSKRSEKRVEELRRRSEEVGRSLRAAQQRLAEVDPVVRLTEFVAGRRSGTQYKEHKGHVDVVHEDLRALARCLARAQEAAQGTASQASPVVERIILYVDDLDRCVPSRVVDVLHAVNLLQTLDLFMVVVSVDAKWLRRSLVEHDRSLFAKESTPPVQVNDELTERSGDPMQYLDKIFQVPFALHALTSDVAARYMTQLAHPIVDGKNGGPGKHEIVQAGDRTVGDKQTAPQSASPRAQRSLEPAKGSFGREVWTKGPTPKGSLNRRPATVTLVRYEVAFLAAMSPFLSTPRSVKKLLNLYQLGRAGVPTDQLDAVFLNGGRGEFRVVAILLAMLVGAPAQAAACLDEMLNSGVSPEERDRTLEGLVDSLRSRHRKLHGMPASSLNHTSAVARVCSDCRAWHRIASALRSIYGERTLPTNLADFREWAREISRYSFHTETLWTSLTPEQQQLHTSPGQ